MTAQAPERIILDGRPRQLFADPLYRLCKNYRLDLRNPSCFTTANYRGYIGTWELRDSHLYLVHLCWDDGWGGEVTIPDELRRKVSRAAAAIDFPVNASWFTGVARIALGHRLVYSHHGWSHWFERERVLHVQGGKITRDREVDTRAILERQLRRRPKDIELLTSDHPLGPLTWFDRQHDDLVADWWPPDFERAR
jgi:hypothetical protein